MKTKEELEFAIEQELNRVVSRLLCVAALLCILAITVIVTDHTPIQVIAVLGVIAASVVGAYFWRQHLRCTAELRKQYDAACAV